MVGYFKNYSLTTLFSQCFLRILHDIASTPCNTFEVRFYIEVI